MDKEMLIRWVYPAVVAAVIAYAMVMWVIPLPPV